MRHPEHRDTLDPAERSVVIKVTRSRIGPGLLNIPSASREMFPATPATIKVRFDDRAAVVEDRKFIPGDTSAKEARIYGLSGWFRDASIKPGEYVRIVVEQGESPVYWIVRDDHYRDLVIAKIIDQGEIAITDSEAEDAARRLAQFVGRRSKEAVKHQIIGLARRYEDERRRAARISLPRLPARQWVRALLGELYDGRCQLCSFTFIKADGQPYYEIHHIDAEHGDDPHNLLVVCSNCHAKLTHGSVPDLVFQNGWLSSISLCGSEVRVKQYFGAESAEVAYLFIFIVLASGLLSQRLHL